MRHKLSGAHIHAKATAIGIAWRPPRSKRNGLCVQKMFAKRFFSDTAPCALARTKTASTKLLQLIILIDSLCISSNAAAGRWNKEGTVKVSGTQFGRCLPSASKRCPRGVPFGRFFLFVLSPRRPIWSGRQAGWAGWANIYGTWDPQRWDHCVTVSHPWSYNQNTCSADIKQNC